MGTRTGILGLGLPSLHLSTPFRPKPGSGSGGRSGPLVLGLSMGVGKHSGAPTTFGFSGEEIDDGRREVNLLNRVFGSFARAGQEKFNYMSGAPEEVRIVGYLEDRAWFFGPGEYHRHLDEARAQLDANKGKLRNLVEPPLKKRSHLTDWRRGQDVFYAWVRRAYERSGVRSKDVPELISSGLSSKLRETLKAVAAKYGKGRYAKLKLGKSNPRPIKHTGHYALGTLSDHAFGNAVDINDNQNAQIKQNDWDSILKFTHMSLNKSSRETLWSNDPQKLHTAIVAINAAFVRNLQAAMAQARTDAKTKAGKDPQKMKAAAAMTDEAALKAAVAANPPLHELSEKWVREHQAGFFNLPWDLVKALRDEDCVWGAVFNTVDLHHFQLPDPLPPPLPGRVNLLLTPRRPDSDREA